MGVSRSVALRVDATPSPAVPPPERTRIRTCTATFVQPLKHARHARCVVHHARSLHYILFAGVRAPAAAAAAASSPRLADTRLGDLFLRLLPGQLYYLPALLYPLVSLAAGLGAAYGPSLAARLAALPFVKVRTGVGGCGWRGHSTCH